MTRRCCIYCGTEMNEWYNESIPLTGPRGSFFFVVKDAKVYI